MISVELDTEQAKRGILKVAQWADFAHEPIRNAIRLTAEDVKRDAAATISRQGPPRSIAGRPPAKESGFLLRSLQIRIGREKRKKGERAYVVSKQIGLWFYGFMLESGTQGVRRIEPRPFLVPAQQRHTAAFVSRVQDAIEKAIRESTTT